MTSFILSMASLLSKNKLYLFCLLLTFASAFFISDILSFECLGKSIIETIETSINVLNILIFITTFMFCYFIAMTISYIIGGAITVITRFFCLNMFDRRDYYSLYEIREKSIIDNNKVMYEEYKTLSKEKNVYKNTRIFLLITIIAFFYDYSLNKDIANTLENYKFLCNMIIVGILSSIFYFLFTQVYINHTGIRRNPPKINDKGSKLIKE